MTEAKQEKPELSLETLQSQIQILKQAEFEKTNRARAVLWNFIEKAAATLVASVSVVCGVELVVYVYVDYTAGSSKSDATFSAACASFGLCSMTLLHVIVTCCITLLHVALATRVGNNAVEYGCCP